MTAPSAFDPKELRRLVIGLSGFILNTGDLLGSTTQYKDLRAFVDKFPLSALASHTAVRDKALEEAARRAEEWFYPITEDGSEKRVGKSLAMSIRALKGAPT